MSQGSGQVFTGPRHGKRTASDSRTVSPRESASGMLIPGFDEESIINMAKQDIVKLFGLEVVAFLGCAQASRV